ncbi:TlpA family protein disulfide reductase [Niabella hibiscisoli]|uniref:TlpA family protein disulfide reductase n=1 Tax=Niabella hibiscisoli TaxID=1825928 RepID=UPI001F10E680|nr:TlpA disulfide reductase family protein [Niabella hibiscisoli]MCH5719121.1 TlpA family protein disulfide reductase [Niabella hibiscisoli]
MIRLHRIASAFKFELRSASADTLMNYLGPIKESLYNEFYRQQSDILLNETLRKRNENGIELPESYAGALFKKMIAPYAGKVVFVDFWATTCGPCISGIKQLHATRLEYKNNADFTFLFITAKDESPARQYKSFVKKQELTNTYYLDADEYRYIRELFGINGIPRYIVISKEGRVMNDDFEMHNFRYEIGKYLPQYDHLKNP